jgi:hypothetical protein
MMYDVCMYLPTHTTHTTHTVQSCEQDHREGRIARMAQTEHGRRRSCVYSGLNKKYVILISWAERVCVLVWRFLVNQDTS